MRENNKNNNNEVCVMIERGEDYGTHMHLLIKIGKFSQNPFIGLLFGEKDSSIYFIS